MVRYVTEEVDRVKSLFQEKESRLVNELDSAKEISKAAAAECQASQEQLSTAQAKLATVTSELEVCFPIQYLISGAEVCCRVPGTTKLAFQGLQNHGISIY